MFAKLAARLNRDGPESFPKDDDQASVAHAAAMLLFEVAWADHEVTQAEIERVDASLQTLFGLSAGVAGELAEQVRSEHSEATSIYPFAREVKDCLNAEERYRLMVALWRLALADREIAPYEEAAIRSISELLYVSHSNFIRAKLEAKNPS